MKKILIFSAILLATISLAACGGKNSSDGSKNAQQASQSSTLKVKTNKGITHAAYDKIATANITSAKGGTDEQIVKDAFGKPNSTSKVTVNDGSKKAAVQYAWTNLNKRFRASAVTVEFLKGHAVGKGYIEAGLHQRRYIAKDNINRVKTGDTYAAVVKKLGTPAGESLTGKGSLSARSVTYATGKDGKAISLMFTGDKLISKTAINK